MNCSFELDKVNALRRAAARGFPKNDPEGWIKSPVDPTRLLQVFTSLHLKPGFVLRAYSYFDRGNGNAVLYVMRADAPFPEPGQCPRNRSQFLEPPVPPGADERVMRYIEGDSSPWSYVSASILVRELAEFGARWHGCSWSTHTIFGASPVTEPIQDAGDPDLRTWLEPEPDDWRPAVRERNGRVTVTFYTHSALGGERVIRHVDTYEPGTYRFDDEERVIARGRDGVRVLRLKSRSGILLFATSSGSHGRLAYLCRPCFRTDKGVLGDRAG